MSKMIIDNQSFCSDAIALDLVKRVLKAGRISNHGNCYCYASGFKLNNRHIMVYASENKKSDRFEIRTDHIGDALGEIG